MIKKIFKVMILIYIGSFSLSTITAWAGGGGGGITECFETSTHHFKFRMLGNPNRYKEGDSINIYFDMNNHQLFRVIKNEPNLLIFSGADSTVTMSFPSISYDEVNVSISTPNQTINFQAWCSVP